MDNFTRAIEIANVKTGLYLAMSRIGDTCPEGEEKAYETKGRQTLECLAKKDSMINKIASSVYEENEDVIEAARRGFPSEESMNPILKLIRTYSRLK